MIRGLFRRVGSVCGRGEADVGSRLSCWLCVFGHDWDKTPDVFGVTLVVSHVHLVVGAPVLLAGGRSVCAQPRFGV